jgi:bifunctional DNase/RNase
MRHDPAVTAAARRRRLGRRGPVPGGILALALLVALAGWPAAAAPAAQSPPAQTLHEMEVMGVGAEPQSGTPLVFLRSKADKRELYLAVGPFEAQGILLPLQGMKLPRPYTHDLMLEALHRLQARVTRVVITELRDTTFIGLLVLEVRGQELVLDARPSDAIALALREEVPILAAEQVLLRAGRLPSPPESGR